MTDLDRVILPTSPLVQNALSILAETSSVVGESYFPVLVEGLATSLGVRWVLVCKLDAAAHGEARTIACWDNGPAENFVYQLQDTPCADVTKEGVCAFPENIQALYPKDEMLSEMGAQSYAGVTLRSSEGQVLGLIAVLDDKPFPDASVVEQIVTLFSGRAAAELERWVSSSLSERLGKIIETSVSEAYVFDRKSCKFERVNRGARKNLGYTMEELRDLTPWDLKPDFSEAQFREFVQPLIDGSEEMLVFETEHERKDGTRYPVCVQLQYFPDVGDVFFASITDETEKKRQQAHERIIMDEMNHRAKNVLAVVQVLARQTVKRNPEDYIERLESRIAALAASHDVLVHHEWKDLPFEELVLSQLGHFKHLVGKRIDLAGPAVKLKAKAAQAFGMVLHELATNAAKYGALSNDEGRVALCWSHDADSKDDRDFEIVWREIGGPPVAAPEDAGFGSFLIEKSLRSQFECNVDLDYRKSGVVCRIAAASKRALA